MTQESTIGADLTAPLSNEGGTTALDKRGSFSFTHLGQGAELLAIWIVNLLLRIVTLNIYHFWAITRIRRYIWSQTEVDGERLEYTGTGKELFIGFLKTIGFFILGSLIVGLISFLVPALMVIIVPLAYIGFLYLIGVGLYGAAQYEAGHSRLRGVRFALAGSAYRYGFKLMGGMILMALTLGLYLPYLNTKLASYKLNNSYYGGTEFIYDGKGGDLFKNWVIAWLLLIPTLGFSFFWYSAAESRYTAEKMSFPGLIFSSQVTGGQMLWFVIQNMLLLIVTLGLAFPWIIVRNIRFQTENLIIDGSVDYDSIQQSALKAMASGEGLAQALDFQSAI